MQATRSYGGVELQQHQTLLNFDIRRLWVVIFTPWPLYSRGECHPLGWMDPRANVEPLQIGWISCPCQGSSHNFSDVHVAAYTTTGRTDKALTGSNLCSDLHSHTVKNQHFKLHSMNNLEEVQLRDGHMKLSARCIISSTNATTGPLRWFSQKLILPVDVATLHKQTQKFIPLFWKWKIKYYL